VASHSREAAHLIAEPEDSPGKVGAAVMPVETRWLYSSANGDRWYLARDTEAGHVFIKHESNVSSGGRASDIEIGEFLVRGGSGPEHQELLRLIGTLVEDPSQPKG